MSIDERSLDEAIAHAREVAEIQRNNDKLNKTLGKSSPYYNTDCIKCDEEHEQLAEWLEELKDYRDKNKMVVRIDCANSEQFKDIAVKLAKEQYNKAIDDCKELTFREVVYYDSINDRTEFRELAEQLKAGGENDNLRK